MVEIAVIDHAGQGRESRVVLHVDGEFAAPLFDFAQYGLDQDTGRAIVLDDGNQGIRHVSPPLRAVAGSA